MKATFRASLSSLATTSGAFRRFGKRERGGELWPIVLLAALHLNEFLSSFQFPPLRKPSTALR